MAKVISVLVLLLISTFTNGQTVYEKGMQKGLQLMKENKLDEAIAQFERISSVETKNWLPNYYVAINCTFQAFGNMNDQTKVSSYLQKAQQYQDIINGIDLNNPEILVSQAFIHTAHLVVDPMSNGQRLSPIINEIYAKAEKIAPLNPRVIFNKYSFEKGSAEFFGSSTKPMCEKMKYSLELFTNFKPETPFHPTWGEKRAKEETEKCK